ncbi:DUF1499 domain-containing protein [Maricaulaceae bacterium MS644]
MADQPFPIDFATLTPDTRPRRWLVLPAGFRAQAAPDQESPLFPAGQDAVMQAFREIALAAPRTTLTRESGGQIEIVQKSAVFGFPDFVTAQAVDTPEGTGLCLYSRAVMGQYDFNVNKKRVAAWLQETGRRLST